MQIKQPLARILLQGWWHLPVSRHGREIIKTILFTSLPFLFRSTRVYKNWDYTRKLSKPDYAIRVKDFPAHWPLNQADPSSYLIHNNNTLTVQPLAIVVHAFYEELLAEILALLAPFRQRSCKLFAGTTLEKYDAVASMLKESGFTHQLHGFANRGRDILPFLKLSKLAVAEGHPLLLKLHTKKSDHRMSGRLWRKELYNKLLLPEHTERIFNLFERNPGVGFVGPDGHIVPMSLYYGGNARAIGYLAYRLGIDPKVLQGLHFVAGSMFYIRAQALKPLLDLELADDLFEAEKGQHDGTMAHAVERGFALSNLAAGFSLASTCSTPENPTFSATSNHPFTW